MGMDTRESGPHIAGQIAAGLTEQGVAVASAGVISTPGVACLVRKEQFSAGVVISASHNPYQDNGVKLFAGSGMKFPDEIEEQLEAEILRHQNGAASGHGEAARGGPQTGRGLPGISARVRASAEQSSRE